MAQVIPPVLQLIIGLFGLVTALIATYKFVIQRPRVLLEVKGRDSVLLDDGIHSGLTFTLANRGLRYAEDVYVELKADDWGFGEQRRRREWTVSVSPADEPDEDGGDADDGEESAATDEPHEADDETATERAVDTVLDVRHDIQTYFLAPGEINHIFVDDLLYNGSEFTIFYGDIHLEPFRTYELEYAVGCRTYGPRRGTVEIEAGYDDIEIQNRQPHFIRAWMATVSKIATDVTAAGVAVLDSTLGIDVRRAEVTLQETEIERESVSPTKFRMTPVANLRLSCRLDGPRTVTAKATLYLRSASAEELIGTVTFSAYSLPPGARWETRPPQSQHLTNLFDYNIEYGERYADPALPVELSLSEGVDESPELRAEWEVDSRPPRTGDQRGLAVTDCEYRERDYAAVGTIRNENSVDVTVFAIAHLSTEDGTVLLTPYEEVTVEAGGEESFHIGSELAEKHRERIADCSVVLSNAL
ncbi:uncharacterized protein HfgLR_01350 [Haloferax gibbonsii]|uniref:Uncharacterized protein n=1 Tax=Haloferax gibbonsii TaxID=35746 RepID=A0A871BCJ3_HALGI|nr:hypothetical protein [Haloferax gibbonsii]QOS10423.1 uncharacterized protein HfgLR_01350 [Haloferax gibbonsii]